MYTMPRYRSAKERGMRNLSIICAGAVVVGVVCAAFFSLFFYSFIRWLVRSFTRSFVRILRGFGEHSG